MSYEPWKLSNLPFALVSKSNDLKQVAIQTANSFLEKGMTQAEAEFSALQAVTILERKAKPVKKSVEKKPVPQHLLAVLQKNVDESPEPIFKELQGKELTGAYFDPFNRLVLQFNTGQEIKTQPIQIEQIIEQKINVAIPNIFTYMRFPTNTVVPSYEEGVLFYDQVDHSLAYYNDDSQVKVNIGREELVRVYNNTGSLLVNKTVVYINGAISGWPTVSKASATTELDSQSVIGLVISDIENSEYGYVCISGMVNGVDTSTFTEGSVVYLSNAFGELTDVPPLQPSYEVEVATVVVSDAVNGKLLVNVDKKEWHPSLTVVDDRTSVSLPTVPTVYTGGTVLISDGFSYDPLNGEVFISTSGSFGFTILLNAIRPLISRNIYFYAEEDTGSGWVVSKYTGRTLRLPDAQETELIVTANRYYRKGSKLRFYIWGDSGVRLVSTNLPGTTPGTVVQPACRLLIA